MAKSMLVALALWCSAAAADVVAEWNAIALDTVVAVERSAGRAAHAMASVHVAMFEAMSFVEGGYPPRHLVAPPAPLGKSGSAAAAAAAHHVLNELYPQRREALDAALGRSLALLDPQEAANARTWGRQLGAVVHLGRPPAGRGSPPDPSAAIARLAAVNRSLADLIDACGLRPIDRARAHALASTALSDIYTGLVP
jgi:hypothetical protein